MRITHSRDRSETNYFLEKPLKDVHNFKDLGVTITKDLSWDNHIGITVNKANKVLGSIKRSVGTADTNVFSMLYKSLVRPILEYAVPVWCPYPCSRECTAKSIKTCFKPTQIIFDFFYCCVNMLKGAF